eukprot:351121-Chlamydomonas_euryale.AAC.5
MHVTATCSRVQTYIWPAHALPPPHAPPPRRPPARPPRTATRCHAPARPPRVNAAQQPLGSPRLDASAPGPEAAAAASNNACLSWRPGAAVGTCMYICTHVDAS